VSQKGHPFFFSLMSLSFASPKESKKEKESGKDNRSCFSPIAHGHFPLQKTGHGSHLFRVAITHLKGSNC